MSSKSKFIPLDLKDTNVKQHRIQIKNGVLKSQKHKKAGTLRIDPVEHKADPEIEYFQPVYHGDQVIGIIHKCVCERVSEIHFEYESNINKDDESLLEGNEPG